MFTPMFDLRLPLRTHELESRVFRFRSKFRPDADIRIDGQARGITLTHVAIIVRQVLLGSVVVDIVNIDVKVEPPISVLPMLIHTHIQLMNQR